MPCVHNIWHGFQHCSSNLVLALFYESEWTRFAIPIIERSSLQMVKFSSGSRSPMHLHWFLRRFALFLEENFQCVLNTSWGGLADTERRYEDAA